jgi:hypothetical protein
MGELSFQVTTTPVAIVAGIKNKGTTSAEDWEHQRDHRL